MEKQQITIAVDRDVMEAVDRQAEAERSSKSSIIRRVVSAWAKSLAEPAPRLVSAIMLAAGLLAMCAMSAGAQPATQSVLASQGATGVAVFGSISGANPTIVGQPFLGANQGGTGVQTLPANSLLLGQGGTLPMSAITPSSPGQILIDQGPGVNPAFKPLAGLTLSSGGVFSNIVNGTLANMAAGTHKCRETGNGAGAPQDCSYPTISVVDAPYSADPTGTNDSTSAIQAAINALPAAGGDVVFPCGTYKVSSTLALGNGTASTASTTYGMVLRGVGNSRLQTRYAGFASTPCVKILWAGTGSGGVISVNGPLQGWGLQNLYIDCNSVASSVGLKVVSAMFGESRNLTLNNCATGLLSTTVALFGSFTNTNSFHNTFYGMNVVVPAISGAIGIELTGEATNTSNTCYNEFIDLYISVPTSVVATTGLYLQSTDSDSFINLHIPGGNASAVCVQMDYSLVNAFPSATRILGIDVGVNCSGGAAFQTTGTPGVNAKSNQIYVDEANGTDPHNFTPIVNTAFFGSHGLVINNGGNVAGNDILGAWTAFTATPTCGTATIATTSAKSNQIGKTTTLQLNATFSAIGTCTTTMTFTLPRTSQSAGILTFIDSNSGKVGACRIGSGATTATCNFYDATQTFTAASNIFGSGVYENQ